MKTSADFTRDILTNANHSDISEGDSFVPYLVQKYISGVSPEHCNLINSILNTKLCEWNSNQEIYDFLKCFIPKRKGCYYKYFGGGLEDKPLKVDVGSIAKSLEIPTSEVVTMLKYFPQLAKNLTEDKEKILKAK